VSKSARERAAAFTAGAQLAGDVLRLRMTNGLTQRELADLAGIDQGDLSRIERGQSNPTTATFQRLARVLHAELRLVQREP